MGGSGGALFFNEQNSNKKLKSKCEKVCELTVDKKNFKRILQKTMGRKQKVNKPADEY